MDSDWAKIDSRTWQLLWHRLDAIIAQQSEIASIKYGDRLIGDPAKHSWESLSDLLFYTQKTVDLHRYILDGLIDLYWLLEASSGHPDREVRALAYLAIRRMLQSLYMPEIDDNDLDDQFHRLLIKLEDLSARVDLMAANLPNSRNVR